MLPMNSTATRQPGALPARLTRSRKERIVDIQVEAKLSDTPSVSVVSHCHSVTDAVHLAYCYIQNWDRVRVYIDGAVFLSLWA